MSSASSRTDFKFLIMKVGILLIAMLLVLGTFNFS